MGRCIERLRDEVLTFVNVRSHRSVIPAPISALHYRDIAFKKKKVPGNGWTKIKIKRNPTDASSITNVLRVSQGELPSTLSLN